MKTSNQYLNTEDQAYLRAKKKVEKRIGFYSHLIIYLIINLLILVIHYYHLSPSESFWSFQVFSTFLFWGIGLLIHAINVFGSDYVFSNEWEQRQIKKYMDKHGLNNN